MTRPHLLSFCLALPLLAACSSGTPPRAANTPHPLACAPLGAPSLAPESLTVAIASFGNPSDALAFYAPAMRFVDAQLYETLVQLDCEGSLAPGLASAWNKTATGRVRLTLRGDARFWNGDPVTSHDVVESWRSAPSGVIDSIDEATRRTVLAEATIIDEHSLSIPVALLRALGDRSLAIRRQTTPQSWAEGTGPFRPSGSSEQLNAVTLIPVTPEHGTPKLIVRTVPYGQARDQLDAGVDVLLTSDLTTLSYASGRPDLVSIPLNWSRTYVLAAPVAPAISASATVRTDTIRMTLARDVVRVDARAAEPPFWWTDSTCASRSISEPLSRDSVGAQQIERLAYRSDDPIARQLAERLVALAAIGRAGGSSALGDLAPGVSPSRSLRAEALAPRSLAGALTQGHRGFVLSVPSHQSLNCDQIDRTRATGTLSVIPLIDVRDHVIVRRGRASFVVDQEGIPHMGASTP